MDFDAFLNSAWDDHGTNAIGVRDRLPQGVALITSNDQIAFLANFSAHLFGEHLGAWNKGVQFLSALRELPVFVSGTESEFTINRLSSMLRLAGGDENIISSCSATEKIRILAIAASALSGQGQPERAKKYFLNALEIANGGLDPKDPANRALAVTGNNLACTLEEKSNRTALDTELMILAAQTGRKYWEIAGTPLHVGKAEYRLAMTYLIAGKLTDALKHANNCIAIHTKNSAPETEIKHGHEVLRLVQEKIDQQKGTK